MGALLSRAAAVLHVCVRDVMPLPAARDAASHARAHACTDVDALQEVLNAAYAQHELVSEPTGEMLDFFEQQLRAQRRR